MAVDRSSSGRVTKSQGEGAIFSEYIMSDKPNTLIIANWTGPCSGTRQGQTFDCKLWTSLLSAAKWAVIAHRGRSLMFTIALFHTESDLQYRLLTEFLCSVSIHQMALPERGSAHPITAHYLVMDL